MIIGMIQGCAGQPGRSHGRSHGRMYSEGGLGNVCDLAKKKKNLKGFMPKIMHLV